MKTRILVVDDEKSIRITIQLFLTAEGHEVDTVNCAAAALELLEREEYDVVVSDIIMPGLSGVELLNHVRKMAPGTEVVLITGEPTVETATAALRAGAADYLAKPVTKDKIIKVVSQAIRLRELLLDRQRLEAENQRHQETLEQKVADRSRDLQKLAEVSLSFSGDPQEVIRLIAEAATGLTKADLVVISEATAGGEQRICSHFAVPDESRPALPAKALLENALCREAFQSKSIQVIREVADRLPAGMFERASCVGVPVMNGSGDVIATLALIYQDPPEITAEQKWLLQIFAKRLGSEVERAQHLREWDRLRLEAQRLEQQHQHSQRLESIGRLAGGIAHDLNNLLTVILNSGELLSMDIDFQGEDKEYFDAIVNSSEQAKELVAQMLAFSRKQHLSIALVDVNSIVREFEVLIRSTVPEDIRIKLSLTDEPTLVRADSNQIGQVLMNLMVNAKDAMPEGGEIVLATNRTAPSPEDSENPHGWVQLSVSDNGSGMSEEVRDNIFEPFFTTKESGGGTGLGLSTAYGIVRQHGGEIEVDSEPGQGTTFRIRLAVAADSDSGVDVAAELGTEITRTGTETILLVEDNESVRRTTCRVLEANGYQVLEADCGAGALSWIERHPEPIDLVVTDVIMPNMNGREVAEAVRLRYPAVPVLFMSGYIDQIIDSKKIVSGDIDFIAKPYTCASMLEKVRRVLDRWQRSPHPEGG